MLPTSSSQIIAQMKIATISLGLLSLLSLSACSDKNSSGAANDKIITSNDFESAAGWNVDPTLLYRGRAHSGQYAIKVDGEHEFSLTFDMPLAQATPTKIKTVHLEAWALLPSDKATGQLGVQVMKPENLSEQVFGEGIQLQEVVKKYNEWVKVSKDITLPDDITPMQHLRVTLWRAGSSEQVLVDDVELSIKD